MQFKAGYIIDSVSVLIDEHKELNRHNNEDLDKINGLLKHLSCFDTAFPHNFDNQLNTGNLNSVLATLNNIITRGLPTKAPVLVEEQFVKAGLTEDTSTENEFSFNKCALDLDFEDVFKLMHIIEPGLKIDKSNYGGKLGSNLEWEFIRKNPIFYQILQSQRDFSTINSLLQAGRSVDFSFQSPYMTWDNDSNCYVSIGRIFEIDGPHHLTKEYQLYDLVRDDLAKDEAFDTYRFTREAIISGSVNYDNLLEKPINKIFSENFIRDINKDKNLYTLIFTPFAVARIQKTIIETLLRNPHLIENKNKLKIAIIERDVQCGILAIESIKQMLYNINCLLEDGTHVIFPEIEAKIFTSSKKWHVSDDLNFGNPTFDATDFANDEFDIVLDHSFLRRSDIYKDDDFKEYSEKTILVRSAHYYDISFGMNRRVYCAPLLDYKDLVIKNPDTSYTSISETVTHIEYFLQNIFRKKSFREGQLPIISRALQQKPVIGLLPTGGGKSLTYQLPALLQPGISIIVDPIKSLMEDQVRVLKNHKIDFCDFINSNIKREEKQKRLIDFRYGETLLFFVSPERFVMDDFRSIISSIRNHFGLAFSYCIIDEVHCVSEWGHDFRTTYLMLGKNSQIFLRNKLGESVSLIGLTATASFDVLADIERELQIEHSDLANSLIMIENTIRPEMFLRVLDVTHKDRISALNDDFTNMGFNLAKYNSNDFLEQSLLHHFIEFENQYDYGEKVDNSSFYYPTEKGRDAIEKEIEKLKLDESITNASVDDLYSIIFCPTKGKKVNVNAQFTDTKGVPFVFSKLKCSNKGFFYATDEQAEQKNINDHFANFIGKSGDVKHMVCTKAFGMGIDKENVRATYHYYYASSMENQLQESGRAGRDRKISESVIILSNETYWIFDVIAFLNENRDKISNGYYSYLIRNNFESRYDNANNTFIDIIFDNESEVVQSIENFNELRNTELKNLMLSKNSFDTYKYIVEKRFDRSNHDFFYKNAFKGENYEKAQILDLFNGEESLIIGNHRQILEGQPCLKVALLNSKSDYFYFKLFSTRKYNDNSESLCSILGVNPTDPINPPQYMQEYGKAIDKLFSYAKGYDDFLLKIKDSLRLPIENLNENQKKQIYHIYHRERSLDNETGRIIYRMHSMGLIEDYTIDFKIDYNVYECKFRRYKSIDDYLNVVEKYFRRYLSESASQNLIRGLKNKTDKLDNNIIAQIIECLNTLVDFAYREIASKRKRATNEIERVLHESITNDLYKGDDNWFKRNLYLKEEIYFYFNAKYARHDYKIDINGQLLDYSLLDDYQSGIAPEHILSKYLTVFQLEPTEQNNYKHMIGSCKKIIRSLAESQLNTDWVLHLLKAFAMYSTNNPSYVTEANSDIEIGFINLYEYDKSFKLVNSVFDEYFNMLLINLDNDNHSLTLVKGIRFKVLQSIISLKMNNLIDKYKAIN